MPKEQKAWKKKVFATTLYPLLFSRIEKSVVTVIKDAILCDMYWQLYKKVFIRQIDLPFKSICNIYKRLEEG